MKPPTLAREVAEADHVLTNARPAVHTAARRSNGLVESAKRIQRLQTKAAKLRRELKATLAEITHEKRMLRGLAGVLDRGDQ